MRYGLGWRPELGAAILANLDRIDVVEVLAEELFDADGRVRRALRFLQKQVPVVLHATSLGLASSEPVERKRLDAVARVVDWLQPDFWSEHLAFVRSGRIEVGHLAAPPRNDATLAGLVRNFETARRLVGSAPLLENVASLVDPPGSSYDERAWLLAVLDATGCRLLLDLHNVHANAVNFGFDAAEVVRSIPTTRIEAVHLAGGRTIERQRILDDHLHDVPDAVFDLLPLGAAANATVILERDGNYPPIEELLIQLDRARAAIASAPVVRTTTPAATHFTASPAASGTPLLHFLARLYTDPALRIRFTTSPAETARAHGLTEADSTSLASLDFEDLHLAAHSFERKRAAKARHAGPLR